jgi:similar to stage IV sporulation protein
MTQLLWLWWQGYLTVRLRGAGIERLLNRASQVGVALFRVERLTSDVVLVRMAARDFRLLRPLLREAVNGPRISVSVLDRHGLPFVLRRFRRRSFLGVGLGLAVLAVFYLANFVWFVQVFGNQALAVEAIKTAVEDAGLRMGIPRSSLDPARIERKLLESLPDLVWVQVKNRGVRVEVHVVERDEAESGEQRAGHIYAKQDGLVTELLVLQGTAQIREGDTVRKDDLLISGMYYDHQGRRQYGAARGIVKARVWYEAVGEASLVRWEPLRTGRRRSRYLLTVGPLTIPIGRSLPRENHLVTSRTWQLYLGTAMAPVSWTRLDYEEVEWETVPVPAAEAEQNAYELAWESLLAQGVDRERVLVEKRAVENLADGNGIRVTVRVEVLEDIGRFSGQ